MLPPQSCAGGGTFVPDFAAMDSQIRHQRQQRYQPQQVVPDPPPYPGRSQPTKAPPQQASQQVAMMQMMGSSTGPPPTQPQHRGPAYAMSFTGQQQPAPHFSRLYDNTATGGGGGGDYR